MIVKNHELYNSFKSLEVISKFHFRGLVIFKLAKLVNVVEQHFNTLEFTKNKLIEKYGSNGQITAKHLNFKPFLAEWTDVLQQEIEVDLQKIKLSELNLDDNPIPVEALAKIEWLIEDDS